MKTVQTIGADNSILIRFPNGFEVRQKPMAVVDQQSEAGIAFVVACDAVAELQDATKDVERDDALSTVGRTRKIEPLAIAAVVQVAQSWSAVENYEAHLQKRLDKLVFVPQILPGDAVSVAHDLEIRNHWNSRTVAERARLMEDMNKGPTLQRYELALLRSPVAMADHEIAYVRANWERGMRANDPAEDVAVAAGFATVAWARHGLVQVGAALVGSLAQDVWPSRRLLHIIVTHASDMVQAGFPAFGFSVTDVAECRRRLAAKPVGAHQPNA